MIETYEHEHGYEHRGDEKRRSKQRGVVALDDEERGPEHAGDREKDELPLAAHADRSGDRKLNRALHMILVTRKRSHPATIAYIERRIQEGKTRREATRCLKRYLARNLYRLLEHGAPLAT